MQVTYRLDCGGNGTGCSWVPISAVLPEAVVKADRVTYKQFPINPINNQLVFGGDELVYTYINKTWYGTLPSTGLPANVKDQAKNDCLSKILYWLSTRSTSNVFANMLQTSFGKNSQATLSVYTYSSFASKWGQEEANAVIKKTTTDAITYQPSKITIDIVVSDLLFQWESSQEYTLVTLAHELVHAHLDYQIRTLGRTGLPVGEAAQHEYMATHYVNELANLIRAYNVNFTTDEALALAWGGLEKTAAYKTQVVDKGKKELYERLLKNERKDLYKSFQKGTNCPGK